MKKFLTFISTFALISLTAMGQEVLERDLVSRTNGTVTDTVKTAALTKVVATPNTPGFWDIAAVDVTITKISGTTAGVARLMASMDGVNYFRINPTDSLNVANVSTAQKKAFVLASYPYKYLGVQYIGTGTMEATLRSKALFKRRR